MMKNNKKSEYFFSQAENEYAKTKLLSAIKWFTRELEGGKGRPDCEQCNANEEALEALKYKYRNIYYDEEVL